MFTHETSVRVRYAETDRMGYVYYGNYATYFEVGRVEAMRALNIPYRMLEDMGILLPVAHYEVKYFAPALYDDELRIITAIPSMPTAKIQFDYELFRGDTLLSKASTTLVFVDAKTGKPMRAPDFVLENIRPAFS